MKFVDSHCHINFDAFNDDLSDVLARAKENNVDHMLCVAVNMEDYPQVLELARNHDNIYASVGLHPCYQDCYEPTVEELIEHGSDDNIIAIGETGLDYFRVEGDMGWQHERFIRHIEAAKSVNKPLIIHTRASADDTMMFLEQNCAEQAGGVMHCFAENWETAKRALDIGFYISFSGIVTFKSATELQEVAKKTPLDRILIETDSPYLAPVPHRGKRNEPAYVVNTAQKIADLKQCSLEEIAEISTDNFFELFKIANK